MWRIKSSASVLWVCWDDWSPRKFMRRAHRITPPVPVRRPVTALRRDLMRGLHQVAHEPLPGGRATALRRDLMRGLHQGRRPAIFRTSRRTGFDAAGERNIGVLGARTGEYGQVARSYGRNIGPAPRARGVV
jgi:hypothetical protein